MSTDLFGPRDKNPGNSMNVVQVPATQNAYLDFDYLTDLVNEFRTGEPSNDRIYPFVDEKWMGVYEGEICCSLKDTDRKYPTTKVTEEDAWLHEEPRDDMPPALEDGYPLVIGSLNGFRIPHGEGDATINWFKNISSREGRKHFLRKYFKYQGIAAYSRGLDDYKTNIGERYDFPLLTQGTPTAYNWQWDKSLANAPVLSDIVWDINDITEDGKGASLFLSSARVGTPGMEFAGIEQKKVMFATRAVHPTDLVLNADKVRSFWGHHPDSPHYKLYLAAAGAAATRAVDFDAKRAVSATVGDDACYRAIRDHPEYVNEIMIEIIDRHIGKNTRSSKHGHRMNMLLRTA